MEKYPSSRKKSGNFCGRLIMRKKSVQSKSDRISRILNNNKEITEAIQTGINESLRKHKLLGYPVCVWRDGKVVWIPPNEIKA